MSGSLTDSTLPQTGSSGVIHSDYIEGEPKEKSQNAYKRHLTRGHYSSLDTVRVLLITSPYLKAVSAAWSQEDGKKNNSTPEQIAQAEQYMFQRNSKELLEKKTCFDIELNSDNVQAGSDNSWIGTVKEAKTQKEVSLKFKFSNQYIQRDRGGWFQFTGVVCADEKLDPKNSLVMILKPQYRENKVIQLSWTYKSN
jgi:hypothetical protein